MVVMVVLIFIAFDDFDRDFDTLFMGLDVYVIDDGYGGTYFDAFFVAFNF
jgi:hypothetical protein